MVTKSFQRLVFPRFGNPRVSITDGSMDFIEKKFKAICTKCEVHLKKGLGYKWSGGSFQLGDKGHIGENGSPFKKLVQQAS